MEVITKTMKNNDDDDEKYNNIITNEKWKK